MAFDLQKRLDEKEGQSTLRTRSVNLKPRLHWVSRAIQDWQGIPKKVVELFKDQRRRRTKRQAGFGSVT